MDTKLYKIVRLCASKPMIYEPKPTDHDDILVQLVVHRGGEN